MIAWPSAVGVPTLGNVGTLGSPWMTSGPEGRYIGANTLEVRMTPDETPASPRSAIVAANMERREAEAHVPGLRIDDDGHVVHAKGSK